MSGRAHGEGNEDLCLDQMPRRSEGSVLGQTRKQNVYEVKNVVHLGSGL